MSDEPRVVLSNAQGNFSVELSQDEARRVLAIQKPRRMPTQLALMQAAALAASVGQSPAMSMRRSSYAGEWCIQCGAKLPPGKPRKCKPCRDKPEPQK